MHNFKSDPRFKDIKPLEKKVYLASPTMHGKEMGFIQEAYDTNWMSTVGENIDKLEKIAEQYIGERYAVALSSGTAALHLAVKLGAARFYNTGNGIATPDGRGRGGSLYGRKVFCCDMTFGATVNPVAYEGGEPVFIDTEYDTWNMDPEALDMAFSIYPDVKLVVTANLYGVPGKMDEIRAVCQRHGALMIEDAAESLGATYRNYQTGAMGDLGVISFNGNKIITGSSGGMLLTKSREDANRARKWSTQSREAAPWYQHEEVGYNYRMSNVIAGIVRGQWEYLEEHKKAKHGIYERYKEGLKDLPVEMNPFNSADSSPNYWMSCMIIDPEAMSVQMRGERDAVWQREKGRSCPMEILEALKAFGAEGRPIWKPMHMQPLYRMDPFITRKGSGRAWSNAYTDNNGMIDVGADIFNRGLCLPSDIKMTKAEQDVVIDIVHRCFS
jgi:dTDP-4-amino-4,6-dideoxygalactose transaminase